MILLWQKHANPQGWLTGVRPEAAWPAAAGGTGGRRPPPASITAGRQPWRSRPFKWRWGRPRAAHPASSVRPWWRFRRYRTGRPRWWSATGRHGWGAARRTRTSAAGLSLPPGRGL